MRKSFNFFYNWNNKLQCTAFTTLRLNPNYFIGDEVDIYLNKVKLPGTYTVYKRKPLKLEEINHFISFIDTGYTPGECKDLLRQMHKARNIDWQTQTLFLYLIVKFEEEEEELQKKTQTFQDELPFQKH